MEGANAKELYQLETAAEVLLLRDMLPSNVHVPPRNPPQRHHNRDARFLGSPESASTSHSSFYV